MRHAILIPWALAFGLVLASGAALGFGGGESKSKNQDLTAGAKLVQGGNHADAIPLLQKAAAAEPDTADVHNLLGYSHRKLGDSAAALGFYQKALELKPKHRGANEYLGELYLEMGELEKAEQRLEVLDGACFFGCEEYTDLKNAIKAYKAKQGG